jgi:YD repeat-containing protein
LDLQTPLAPCKLDLGRRPARAVELGGFLLSAKRIAVCVAILALPASALAASTVSYSYDALGQLVSLSSSSGATTSYSYDAAGNRTQTTSTGSVALNGAGTSGTVAAKVPGNAGPPTSLARLDQTGTAARKPAAGETGATRAAAASGAGQ